MPHQRAGDFLRLQTLEASSVVSSLLQVQRGHGLQRRPFSLSQGQIAISWFAKSA